jgi:hypothetical protein
VFLEKRCGVLLVFFKTNKQFLECLNLDFSSHNNTFIKYYNRRRRRERKEEKEERRKKNNRRR